MDEITNNFQSQSQPNPYAGEQTVTFNLNVSDIKGMAGWGSFMAILDIIFGALACITVLGAAYGVTQIISGTKLFAAADHLKRYIATNNSAGISEALYNLSKYFKLRGITSIIRICMTIVIIIIYIIVIVAIVASDPEAFNNY